MYGFQPISCPACALPAVCESGIFGDQTYHYTCRHFPPISIPAPMPALQQPLFGILTFSCSYCNAPNTTLGPHLMCANCIRLQATLEPPFTVPQQGSAFQRPVSLASVPDTRLIIPIPRRPSGCAAAAALSQGPSHAGSAATHIQPAAAACSSSPALATANAPKETCFICNDKRPNGHVTTIHHYYAPPQQTRPKKGDPTGGSTGDPTYDIASFNNTYYYLCEACHVRIKRLVEPDRPPINKEEFLEIVASERQRICTFCYFRARAPDLKFCLSCKTKRSSVDTSPSMSARASSSASVSFHTNFLAVSPPKPIPKVKVQKEKECYICERSLIKPPRVRGLISIPSCRENGSVYIHNSFTDSYYLCPACNLRIRRSMEKGRRISEQEFIEMAANQKRDICSSCRLSKKEGKCLHCLRLGNTGADT